MAGGYVHVCNLSPSILTNLFHNLISILARRDLNSLDLEIFSAIVTSKGIMLISMVSQLTLKVGDLTISLFYFLFIFFFLCVIVFQH